MTLQEDCIVEVAHQFLAREDQFLMLNKTSVVLVNKNELEEPVFKGHK